MSTAFLPESEARSSPHICVRRRSPRKSSKLCPYSERCGESRIRDYKGGDRGVVLSRAADRSGTVSPAPLRLTNQVQPGPDFRGNRGIVPGYPHPSAIVDSSTVRSLPVSPMCRRRLLKLQLPRIALLHPNRAPMLITRRRPLVLRRRNTEHDIVGDDGRALA